MFQGHRVILESRMQVSLGKMAGITGLGKETEIGQLQMVDNSSQLIDQRAVGLFQHMGMNKHQAHEQ